MYLGAIERARLDALVFVNERRLESLDEYVEIVIVFLTAVFFLTGYVWTDFSNFFNLFSLLSTVIIFFFYKIAKALHAIDIRLLVINTFVQLLAISTLLYLAIPIYLFLQNMMIDSFWIMLILVFYLSLLFPLEESGKFFVNRAWRYIEIEHDDETSDFELIKKKCLNLSDNLQFNIVFLYLVAFLTLIFGIPIDIIIVIQFTLYLYIPMMVLYIFYKYYRYREVVIFWSEES